MKFLLIAFCYLFFLLPNLFSQTAKQHNIENGFHDSNTYTILSFEKFKSRIYAFDSSCVDTDLSTVEIALIESLYFKAIDDYNRKIKKSVGDNYKTEKDKKEALLDFSIFISERFYIKQLIPVIDKNGRKRVYINCFGSEPSSKDYFWKNDLIQVMDGGNGYFQIIINIASKAIEYVGINGFG